MRVASDSAKLNPMVSLPLVETNSFRCQFGALPISQLDPKGRALLRSRLAFAAILALGGCVKPTPPPVAVVAPPVVAPPTKADVWQRVASAADIDRIRRTGQAWTVALTEARGHGFRGAIAAEGALLKPSAALARPAPTPGSYSCRLIKLGNTTRKGPVFEKFKPFFCYVEVENNLLTIVKQTGSERPAGRLWEDDNPYRLIYLGSLALGDEQTPRAYGEDAKRDMAGVLERVGPFQWRLVIPWPRGTSKLDVFELTPVEEQPK